MKNTIFIFSFILLLGLMAYGQETGQNIRYEPHESIEVLAKATGKTTGHVLDLVLTNNRTIL